MMMMEMNRINGLMGFNNISGVRKISESGLVGLRLNGLGWLC